METQGTLGIPTLCLSPGLSPHDEGPVQPSPGLWERGGDRGSGEGWGLAQVLKLISRHLPFVNPWQPRGEDKAILMLGSSQLLITRDPSETLWLGSGQGS